jgi:hypothetical protein
LTYGDLLQYLTSLTNGDLEKPVKVFVAGQCLAVTRIDEGDGDGAPILSTGVVLVDQVGACE